MNGVVFQPLVKEKKKKKKKKKKKGLIKVKINKYNLYNSFLSK